MAELTSADVSAVVCTLNSISGIEPCLVSLRSSGVEEIIVVDAGSTDGTREVAGRLADRLLDDPGKGLGQERHCFLPVLYMVRSRCRDRAKGDQARG